MRRLRICSKERAKMLQRLKASLNVISTVHCCRLCDVCNQAQSTFLRSVNSSLVNSKRQYSQPCSQEVARVPHEPVMVQEVLEYLNPTPGKTYVDMTFGAGGHSRKILEHAPNIKLYVLDRDPLAHDFAQKLANDYPGQVVPLLGRFSELPKLLVQYKVPINSIDGFLFDFGCSSMQFDFGERGFSIVNDGPLDMRMDGKRNPLEPSAADVLAHVEETDLSRILKVYGEEKQAKKIARAIIEAKYMYGTLKTTKELAELVQHALGGERRLDKMGRSAHCAVKTFQALRIFVNDELNEINYAMILATHYLRRNGRLITISFHSLEDTVVKRHLTGNIEDNLANTLPAKFLTNANSFAQEQDENAMYTPWKMLHKHVLCPTDEEVNRNPRSRSAKFRASEKVK